MGKNSIFKLALGIAAAMGASANAYANCDDKFLQLIVSSASDQLEQNIQGKFFSETGVLDPVQPVKHYLAALSKLRACQKLRNTKMNRCEIPKSAITLNRELAFNYDLKSDANGGCSLAVDTAELSLRGKPIVAFSNSEWRLPEEGFSKCISSVGESTREARLQKDNSKIVIQDTAPGLPSIAGEIQIGDSKNRAMLGLRGFKSRPFIRFGWSRGILQIASIDVSLDSGKVVDSTVLAPAMYSEACVTQQVGPKIELIDTKNAKIVSQAPQALGAKILRR